MCKTQKKKHFISLDCPMLSVVVFPPLFLNLSLYVILDIPEVPAFKKRAQVFGRWSLYNKWSPFDLKSAIIEYRLKKGIDLWKKWGRCKKKSKKNLTIQHFRLHIHHWILVSKPVSKPKMSHSWLWHFGFETKNVTLWPPESKSTRARFLVSKDFS